MYFCTVKISGVFGAASAKIGDLFCRVVTKTCNFWNKNCGNSSVGRARPCQGRGREFESRFPLNKVPVVESGFFE